MNCPKCGSTIVECIDSRHYGAIVRRRRRCKVCGYRFSTYEISVEDYRELKKKEALLADLLAYADKTAMKMKGIVENEST